MSDQGFDPGPLQTFEITWQNGHIERVTGHQVTTSGGGGILGPGPRRVAIHGEIGGHWRLILTALEEDIRIIRNVTEGEWVL